MRTCLIDGKMQMYNKVQADRRFVDSDRWKYIGRGKAVFGTCGNHYLSKDMLYFWVKEEKTNMNIKLRDARVITCVPARDYEETIEHRLGHTHLNCDRCHHNDDFEGCQNYRHKTNGVMIVK